MVLKLLDSVLVEHFFIEELATGLTSESFLSLSMLLFHPFLLLIFELSANGVGVEIELERVELILDELLLGQ